MEYIELSGGACSDCVQAISNDDYSGMSDAVEGQVRAGVTRVTERGTGVTGLVVGVEKGFSREPCAVCGGLAGDRHEVGYLREEEEEADEPEADEPDEDDLVTSDDRNFYQYGKRVLVVDEEEDRDDAIRAYMDREQFWPDAWSISDHGNAHRIDLSGK